MTARAVTVTVPIRISIDPDGVKSHQGQVVSSLRKATGRALAKAGDHVRVAPGQAWLTQVSIGWFGQDLAAVAGDPQRRLEARIEETIRELAKKAGIVDPPAAQPPAPAPKPIDVASMLKRLTSDDVSDRSIAFTEIWVQVADGDEDAFRLALRAIRPDESSPTANVLSALRELRKRDPKRFRSLFDAASTRASSGVYERRDGDVFLDRGIWPLGHALGGALRVAQAFPELGFVSAHEKLAPGFERVSGLFEAFRAVWSELGEYLRNAGEPTDPVHLDKVGWYAQYMQNLPAILAALADDERIKRLIKTLEPDLVEDVRWLAWTTTALHQLDANLDLYERAFGNVAANQEEVQELRKARALLIRLAAENPVPTAAHARSVQSLGAEAIAGWRLNAADRRVQRLRATRAETGKYLGELLRAKDMWERYLADPDPSVERTGSYAGDSRVPFFHRLEQTRLAFDELSAEADLAADQRFELAGLLGLGNRLAEIQVRVVLLSHWQDTLNLESAMYANDLGDAEDRAKWKEKRDNIRSEIAAAFDAPDYSSLSFQIEQWRIGNVSLKHGLEHAARMKALKAFAIQLVGLAASIAVGNVLGAAAEAAAAVEGISALEVTVYRAGITLAEAGTFTVVTTVGDVAVLDQPFHPGDTAKQFVETVAFTQVAKFLSGAIKYGALEYFRGRPSAQAAAILWGNLALSAGLPVAWARVLHDNDTAEQDAMMVATGLAFGVIVHQISGPRLLAELKRVAPARLHADLIALQAETAGFNREWSEILEDGPSNETQFGRARNRGIRLSARVKGALERLAAIPEETLASAGVTKKDLLGQAALVGKWGDRIAATHFVEGTLVLPRGVLPPDAVRRGPGIYEYHADRVRPDALAQRLRTRGYHVDNAGGTLSVSAEPGAPTKFRLLPAPSSAAEAVVSAGTTRARVLILSAAGPAADTVRKALALPAGKALVEAAKLEPERVREAVLSDRAAEGAALSRLEHALREAGMTAKVIEHALLGAREAAAAQRAATAKGPLHQLLGLAGGGPRAREVLATADGHAVVEAMSLAAEETIAVLTTTDEFRPKLKAEAVAAWRAKGMSAEGADAAGRGIDALIVAKTDVPLTPTEQLLAASGAQDWLDQLAKRDPAGHAALLTAAEREPALLGRAIRSTEEQTLAATSAELAERLGRWGMSKDSVRSVGAAIRELNKIRLTAAREYAELERARVLLPSVPPEDARLLINWGYLPALQRNPRTLAFAAQPGAAWRLLTLVGDGGLTSRFGTDPQVVFDVLERVLRRHTADSPEKLGELVDRLSSPLSGLSDAELKLAVGDVDEEAGKLLERLTSADLEVLRGDLRHPDRPDENTVKSISAKFTEPELTRVLDALLPGETAAVWRPKSDPHIEGRAIPQGTVDPTTGEIVRAGPARLDLQDIPLRPPETVLAAIDRVGTVIGKKISDNPNAAAVWDQARQDVLGNRNPHTDVSRDEMLGDNGIYVKVRRRFWVLVRRSPAAADYFRNAGFDLSGTAAPLLETTGQRQLSDEMRRISLDHMEGFEKAAGSNYRFAVDAENLSFEFHYPNSLRDAIGRRLGLGTYSHPRPLP